MIIQLMLKWVGGKKITSMLLSFLHSADASNPKLIHWLSKGEIRCKHLVH
ncbi:unnamed protein product [Musa acuminata subsp. malaccensis]|uniref:(wild Malaysian banana) hypothetical protein n=1 Tax=Musa acuminata subsp. malaccensis TaxID=214687 RepID=A0A804JVE5_MUSAM|nr:unnamed protein product [Musa acuminata subsp. malaccensis]